MCRRPGSAPLALALLGAAGLLVPQQAAAILRCEVEWRSGDISCFGQSSGATHAECMKQASANACGSAHTAAEKKVCCPEAAVGPALDVCDVKAALGVDAAEPRVTCGTDRDRGLYAATKGLLAACTNPSNATNDRLRDVEQRTRALRTGGAASEYVSIAGPNGSKLLVAFSGDQVKSVSEFSAGLDASGEIEFGDGIVFERQGNGMRAICDGRTGGNGPAAIIDPVYLGCFITVVIYENPRYFESGGLVATAISACMADERAASVAPPPDVPGGGPASIRWKWWIRRECKETVSANSPFYESWQDCYDDINGG